MMKMHRADDPRMMMKMLIPRMLLKMMMPRMSSKILMSKKLKEMR